MTAPDLSDRPDGVERSLTRSGLANYVSDIVDRTDGLPAEALAVRHFRTAGLLIEARFSNAGLADRYAARLVRQCPGLGGVSPDIRVSLVETSQLDWPPLARWRDPDCDRRCFHKALEVVGLRAVYPGGARFWEAMRCSPPVAVQIAETAADRPVWDGGAPLRIPIHWASLDRGWRLLHGATLGRDEGAVLLTGPGGAGKSATVLAGVASGLRTAGDDYVLVECSDRIMARAVYRYFKQDRAGVERFPDLAERLAAYRPNWQGKLEFSAETFYPGCIAPDHKVLAIVLPVVTHSVRSIIEPISANELFRMLVRSTLAQFPDAFDSGFHFCARLSRQVPGFRLSLSDDPGEIAATIDGLLDRLRA